MRAINRDIANYLVEHFAKTENYYIITIISFPVDAYSIDPCTFVVKVPVNSHLDIVYDKVYDILMQKIWGDKLMSYLHAYYSIDLPLKRKFVARLLLKKSIFINKLEDILL